MGPNYNPTAAVAQTSIRSFNVNLWGRLGARSWLGEGGRLPEQCNRQQDRQRREKQDNDGPLDDVDWMVHTPLLALQVSKVDPDHLLLVWLTVQV